MKFFNSEKNQLAREFNINASSELILIRTSIELKRKLIYLRSCFRRLKLVFFGKVVLLGVNAFHGRYNDLYGIFSKKYIFNVFEHTYNPQKNKRSFHINFSSTV